MSLDVAGQCKGNGLIEIFRGVTDGGMPGIHPPLVGPGGYPLHFFSLEHIHVFLGIAQQSALTKHIRDWDIRVQKGFPSGNKRIRDLVHAACCERLLSNYVNLNYSTMLQVEPR